jgi:hypothetical protein
MQHKFEFRGGVIDASRHSDGVSVKFLLFLIAGGKEVSFYDAHSKLGLVKGTDESYVYETAATHVKLMLLEQVPMSERFMYNFYIKLGSTTGQEIALSPTNRYARQSMQFLFKSEAHLMSSVEAYKLFPPNSMQARTITAQSKCMPPLDTFRQIITINRSQASQMVDSSRKLRLS